jgi:uncharacterized protein (DUF433 family)
MLSKTCEHAFQLTSPRRLKILPFEGMIMRLETLSAVEAVYLASACLEASRNRETPLDRILAELALAFDPGTAPVPERVVRKAIEEGVVLSRDENRVLIDSSVVTYLASTQLLEHAALSVEAKAMIYRVIAAGAERVELAPMIALDLKDLVRLCRRVLDSYARSVGRHVVIDPEIMGGLPVIRGTRIPVYTILGRIEEGETMDEIGEDFDHVSREALEAALTYARTHPRRGRPKQFR